MLKIDEIQQFIDSDCVSVKKQKAKVGQKYYDAEHDIQNYRIFYFNAEGKLEEDKTKSNIRICHPFFTLLVDQEVQYVLSGKDRFVKSDNPELQNYLDTYFNADESFKAELYDILTDCVVKGFSYAYAYKGEDDRTHFQYADSIGVVEVREKEASDLCDHVILWYFDRVGKDNKTVTRIQVWDSQQVYYYVKVGSEEMVLDADQKVNPRPHTLYTKEGDEATYYEGFGFIPFFRLDNNKKQSSGLVPVKDLIDDFDLMAAGLSNNIQDTNEALYVVKGFSGDNLDELMTNIKSKKHIGVDDEGDVEIRTIDIPYQARKTKLDLDEKSIYQFGFGLNMNGLKDTSATTNIAIKAAYSLLDLKCNKLEIRLKQFLQKLIAVVLEEINEKDGTAYQMQDVYFDFEREIPTNTEENARVKLTEAQTRQTEINTLLNLATRLDDETIIKGICEQLDIDYEEIKSRLPKQDETSMYQNEGD